MPDDTNPSPEEFISTNGDIDVNRIMTAIQERIREKKESGVLKQKEIDEIADMELLPLPDFLEVPNVYEPHLYPQENEPEKEFRPFSITFEQETGTGLRGLVKKVMVKTRKLFFPLIRFMTRPIYNELKQFSGDRFNENAHNIFKNAQQSEANRRLSIQSKEYIKLLHNSLNNMIVEFSKLKIDQELLKTRIKVLEDKIEFIENRERAIEKKLFPG